MAEQERRPNRLLIDASLAEAATRRDGDWLTVGGIVSATTTVATAAEGRIAFLTLADFHATIEVLVPAGVLAAFEPRVDDVILAGGRLVRRTRRTLLRAQLVERFELEL